jgi:hypothetical protein
MSGLTRSVERTGMSRSRLLCLSNASGGSSPSLTSDVRRLVRLSSLCLCCKQSRQQKVSQKRDYKKKETNSMARPNAKGIKEAAEKAQLSLTDEQASKLEKGESIKLEAAKIKTLGGCSGIKIVDLGGGCGLYYNFPAGISVCCQT